MNGLTQTLLDRNTFVTNHPTYSTISQNGSFELSIIRNSGLLTKFSLYEVMLIYQYLDNPKISLPDYYEPYRQYLCGFDCKTLEELFECQDPDIEDQLMPYCFFRDNAAVIPLRIGFDSELYEVYNPSVVLRKDLNTKESYVNKNFGWLGLCDEMIQAYLNGMRF